MEANNLIQAANDAIYRARNLVSTNNGRVEPHVANEWYTEVKTILKDIGEAQRREGLSTPLRQHLLATIVSLSTLTLLIHRATASVIVHVGAGSAVAPPTPRVKWIEVESAFESRIKTGVIVNFISKDLSGFLEEAGLLFSTQIRRELAIYDAIKVNAILNCEFVMFRGKNSQEEKEEEIVETKSFNTRNEPIYETTDLLEWFDEFVRQPILRDIEEFQERDSGWSLEAVLNLVININKLNPLRGSTYVDLPQKIKTRRACINVKNQDNRCFEYAVLSALHPVPYNQNPHRQSKYELFLGELKFGPISFPVNPRQVPLFEQLNNDISVNVFMLKYRDQEYKVVPCYITKLKKENHINLLLIQNYYIDEKDNDGWSAANSPLIFHYVWIKNLSRLINAEYSSQQHRLYICDRCLHFFRYPIQLERHEEDCREVNKCRVMLPIKGENDQIKFQNYKFKDRVPIIVYADLEVLLKPQQQQQHEAQAATSTMHVVHHHQPFSIGFYVHCTHNASLCGYHSYRGTEPAKWFAEELVKLADQLEGMFANPVPMLPLTPAQQHEFQTATSCYICEQPLTGTLRVKDHCHFTGVFRGAAHNTCNLKFKSSRTIPVVFHFFSGYDSHFVIKDVANMLEGRINVLPINKEKYIAVTKHLKGREINFRFIDSLRFMAASLEKLASNLPTLPITKSQLPTLSSEQFELVTRKGIFPYEYIDSFEKLDESELPPKSVFFSQLNGIGISDEDYAHAQHVWEAFNVQTIGEYADIYLQTDVLLLADIFENFRNNCMQAYDLDPAHYYTAPGLAWDAMLKYTKIELELITDIDMLMFVERGIRGGVSQCNLRYAKANNPYMGDSFDDTKPSRYLLYLDVNNLYGHAMVQPLPFKGFEWVDVNIDWEKEAEQDLTTGFFLEVDLSYPESIHQTQQDLPFCPVQGKPPGSKQKKLLTTLEPKLRYVIHFQNLIQAKQYGVVVTKTHRILKFQQKPWLKPYIDKNTDLRTQATNTFEKDLYKFMNNAVFGKTMENVRKRVDVKLAIKWEGPFGAESLIARPNFHSSAIFDENLVAVQLSQMSVLINKPIYVGFSVLELSKKCLYDFHYDKMPKMFAPQTYNLCYSDTDSLIYDISCDDVYTTIRDNIEYFDTSDYPSNNVYNIPLRNKKVIGKMKDENNGEVMTEFVGLRSKMYAIRVKGADKVKKCKGVKSGVVKRTITFHDYVQCLKRGQTIYRTQFLFRSHLHLVNTIKQTKLALNPHDDKRFIKKNGMSTLPWGHCDLSKDDDDDVEMSDIMMGEEEQTM